jgi:hypothetical protein
MLFFILGENLKYFLIKFISLDNIYLLVNQINREFVFSHDFFSHSQIFISFNYRF